MEEDRLSSGSEREVAAPPAQRAEGEDDAEQDHETEGLVLQQDSFDDELPYVPTTLPMERCARAQGRKGARSWRATHTVRKQFVNLRRSLPIF